jgi:hypothetical protein
VRGAVEKCKLCPEVPRGIHAALDNLILVNHDLAHLLSQKGNQFFGRTAREISQISTDSDSAFKKESMVFFSVFFG